MGYQVLARKWRPRTFGEMVGQEHVLRPLINALDNGRLHHAFLFAGTRGVGKTTIARILAKALNCDQGVGSNPCGECAACRDIDAGRFVDLIEVDAASRTKVEDTRDLLENVQYAPTRGRYKVYLIDEVHMLSNHSFNALLKTLEEPPPHVKFLLATTDPQRLPVTVLSRCLQFNLRRLLPEQISTHLQQVLLQEDIPAEAPALAQIARVADGSMRDALSLLDQAIAYGGGELREQEVRTMLGTIEQCHLFELLGALVAGNGMALLRAVENLARNTPDFSAVLAELISSLHQIALLQIVPQSVDELLPERDRYLELANGLTPEDIQLYYQIALLGRKELELAPEPRSGFEMIMLRMLAFQPDASCTDDRESPIAVSAAGEGAPEAPKSVESSPAPQAAGKKGGERPCKEKKETDKERLREPLASSKDEQWAETVAALKLNGMTRQLALNCVCKGEGEGVLELVLMPQHKHLLSERHRQRLEAALQTLKGGPLKVVIACAHDEGMSPAAIEQHRQLARRQRAEQAIREDSNIQNMIDTFGAEIQTDSIVPAD